MLYVEPYAGVAPIIQVINDARYSINLGAYYLPSGKVLDALHAAHARGVKARISGADKCNVAWLVKHGVHVRLLTKRITYLHAKAVSGGQYGFVGSENFSTSSLNENREVGVIIKGADLTVLKTQLQMDWKAAVPFLGGSNQGAGEYAGGSHRHHWEHHWRDSGYSDRGDSSWEC